MLVGKFRFSSFLLVIGKNKPIFFSYANYKYTHIYLHIFIRLLYRLGKVVKVYMSSLIDQLSEANLPLILLPKTDVITNDNDVSVDQSPDPFKKSPIIQNTGMKVKKDKHANFSCFFF